jgi:6-phosphogluconate dehydrogenase
MLVPAGPPVDSAIADLSPHLERGDLIIDAGNSYFKDTNLRARDLAGKGIQFLGVGVSGGEEGARHGPSIMPGGPKEAYERVRPLLEAWKASPPSDFPNYAGGTWGPDATQGLLVHPGHSWPLPMELAGHRTGENS